MCCEMLWGFIDWLDTQLHNSSKEEEKVKWSTWNEFKNLIISVLTQEREMDWCARATHFTTWHTRSLHASVILNNRTAKPVENERKSCCCSRLTGNQKCTDDIIIHIETLLSLSIPFWADLSLSFFVGSLAHIWECRKCDFDQSRHIGYKLSSTTIIIMITHNTYEFIHFEICFSFSFLLIHLIWSCTHRLVFSTRFDQSQKL